MAHLKRQKVPKNWPIPRKGSAFVVKPNYSLNKGIPILVILRDVLKIASNRREVKEAIHSKSILHNNKIVRDEKNNVVLFDAITIVPSKKHYRITFSELGKFSLEEIKAEEAEYKISKVIDKKILKGKKTQINLSDGRNFITEMKCNTEDSVFIRFKDKKIERCLPLKEKSRAIVFAGKHTGKKGTIIKLKPEQKMASLEVKDGNINVLIKQIMVLE